ncbi:Dual-specificity RNA methyltransferase RlmN 1 [Auxenochlorella protothecoides]|uniref:Dual-specificity RNA methyltransferase RlmN 1 n=1 Tax=Auxenochlorella protothecoides TaxID=3075 RepID=A0A087SEX8_AUXPR|nr:Dual-specificity RNA methyltransferase RlmN 1 [Auxenochlorella protothecoides]KFM24282.1 Dual-specificity RNA methyltransferase RlmN 1 [Auxenochlorella protothecoides]
MPKKRVLSPQSVWDEPALRLAFDRAGVKALHLPPLYRHLLRHPDASWSDVPDLPRAAVDLLTRDFAAHTTTLVHAQTSGGGDATKLLVRLQDGLQVEAVIMHEVGCAMACTFCATGTMGLSADLTAGEIVEQLVHARRQHPIRNVVFMGMGEPLNNYVAVRAAILTMVDPASFALRRSAVTLSTVGVAPRIRQLAADLPGVSLALSLHAPTQELRAAIVPSARAYPLDRLMAAVAEYQAASGQRVFVEYVLLGEANCRAEHAHALGALLSGRNVVVNLIPWNPILSPAMDFRGPAPGQAVEFAVVLREQYGLPTTIRQEKGQASEGWEGGRRLAEEVGNDAMVGRV